MGQTKILVAGGGGYVGSVLVPRLLNRGYRVTVVDKFWFGNYLGVHPNLSLVNADISNVTTESLDGYTSLIFLGGLSNDPMAEFSPFLNFVQNVAVPVELIYKAKEAGVSRFIFASSCSVYGFTGGVIYDEDSETTTISPYGLSKILAEKALLQFIDGSLSVMCLRQGTISGYSPRMRFDLVINKMFIDGVKSGIIHVNSPSIWRPILAIQDAATAYVRALESPLSVSGIFNILSENYTLGEMADLVYEVLFKVSDLENGLQISIHDMQDLRNYRVSGEKAEQILSFKPQFTITEIVRELWDKIGEFGDYQNDRYYNVRVFRSRVGFSRF